MYNEKQVKLTLGSLIKILDEEKVEYRLLGSVVTAAINGKLHRRLGDIDLMLDKEKESRVFTRLKSLGYKRASGMFAFGRKYLALETLIHPELQSIGYFWGSWKKDGSFYMGNKFFNAHIESRGVAPNKYSLAGINFIGIPLGAIATGIMSSKHNKKRKKEVELLGEKKIEPINDNYIHIKLLGIPFDWAYHGSTRLLNLLGFLRQKIGLPFDPWRSKVY
jgi:hypothetical protein